MRVLGLDMDEVLASLHHPWLVWINNTFNVNRDPDAGFPNWDEPVETFGHAVYDFLTPSIYDWDIVKPIPGTLEAVNRLREKYVIVVVSSCLNDTYQAKVNWCIRHGFIDRRDFFLPMMNKADAPVDILVDDHIKNCASFNGRAAILMTRPHNVNEVWPNSLRINHLSDLLPVVDSLYPQEGNMGSTTASYVVNAAQALLPAVRRLIAQNGTISASDLRQSREWTSDPVSSLMDSEQASAITMAFRQAGLVRTDLRVTNTAPAARHRKTYLWAPRGSSRAGTASAQA